MTTNEAYTLLSTVIETDTSHDLSYLYMKGYLDGNSHITSLGKSIVDVMCMEKMCCSRCPNIATHTVKKFRSDVVTAACDEHVGEVVTETGRCAVDVIL
jgi:hypothetical protein